MKKIFTLLVMFVAMIATSQAATPDYLCFYLPSSKLNPKTSIITLDMHGTFTVGNTPHLEYSSDLSTWTAYPFGTKISVSSGKSIYFRARVYKDIITINNGKNAKFSDSYDNYIQFTASGTVYAKGNIMSLLDATCQQTSVPDCAFINLFRDCTYLKTAPALPATTLGVYSYGNMFFGCTSLITAPECSATSLADGCYYSMFAGCTSLINAPSLPATTLSKNCYGNMFNGCSNLSSINVKFTEWTSATEYWVEGVAATGTFTCPSALKQETGTSYIPEGWTVKFASATGVEEVQSAEFTDHSDAAYNLAGQRVGANARGIIIKNGKKYLK